MLKLVHNNDKGIVVHEDEGIHILTGRRKVPITIKISKAKHGVDGISFCVEDQSPGRKMRIHKHLNNDELIFIHKGEGTLTLDEQSIEVKTGDVAFVPRGTWHGLDNTGKENLLMIFQYSPAGFEEYFIENGTLVGMQRKKELRKNMQLLKKNMEWFIKNPLLLNSTVVSKSFTGWLVNNYCSLDFCNILSNSNAVCQTIGITRHFETY